MWISKKEYRELLQASAWERAAVETLAKLAASQAQVMELQKRLADETARMSWFMHRLNQVEHERGQLIHAAIGIKVATPHFVPADEHKLGDVLQEQIDLTTVGGDAKDDDTPGVMNDPTAGLTMQDAAVDFSQMPGYRDR